MIDENFKRRLIRESTYPLTLSLLLEDAEEVEEAQKASEAVLNAIQQRLTKIQSLIGKLPNGPYRSGLASLVADQFKDKLEDLGKKLKASGDAGDNTEDTAKAVGILASEADEQSQNLQAIIRINTALVRHAAGIVLKGKLHQSDSKDIALSEIVKEQLSEKGFKDLRKEMNGVLDKAGRGARNKKGMFPTFAKLADKIFGTKFDPIADLLENAEGLVDGILDLTPVQIGQFAQDMINYSKEDKAAAEKVTQASEKVAEDVADEAQVEQADGDAEEAAGAEGEEQTGEESEAGEELTGEDAELEAEEVEEADELADKAEDVLGNLPFGKLELTKLLKAFPELAGKGNKATTQRRAFRKAINQAAGQEIFEEGKQKDFSDETVDMARMRKLAGIK